jgi:hypothetical protein
MIGTDGHEVPNPVFPFEIILKPTDEIRNKFPSAIDASGNYDVYEDQIASIEPNTVIWEVYGRDKPT